MFPRARAHVRGARVPAQRQNEFPTLAGTSTPPISLGTGYSGIASGKVLNAKKATRTAGSASQVWDRVERAAASMPASRPAATQPSKGKATMNGRGQVVPGAAFPVLGNSSAGGGGKTAPSGTTSAAARLAASTSTTTGSGYSSAAQPLVRSVHMPVVSSSKSGRAPVPPSKSAFPSLPATSNSKERPNFARDDMVRRMKGDKSFVPTAGWQSPPEGTTPAGQMDQAFDEDAGIIGGSVGGGGKKKKKGKEMLFTLGQARGT